MKTFWILRGEGIECEKESFRFFSTPNLKLKCEYVLIPEILANPEKALSNLKAGDWMVFPGGFSFADHLGSGRLLSFKFGQKKVFEQLIQKKVHMIGICNGFQILSAGKLFGDNVFLERNQPGGFVNKNVKLKGWREQDFYFTCRHGEGRLVIEGDFKAGVQTLMTYNDEHFNNGSQDKIAGLVARHQDS